MNDLKMLTVEEVTDLLNTSKNTLTMLRETGALKAIKTFEGYSMDNHVNINASIEDVKSKQLGA